VRGQTKLVEQRAVQLFYDRFNELELKRVWWLMGAQQGADVFKPLPPLGGASGGESSFYGGVQAAFPHNALSTRQLVCSFILPPFGGRTRHDKPKTWIRETK
jgi:hypothetical protein